MRLTFCQEQELDLENVASSTPVQPLGTLLHPTFMTFVGRPEPRIVVIATMGYLDEFWFSVVLGVSHRDDHFCQRNHGRISFGF